MTDDEYRSRRAHLRSINVHTADCPPDDELAVLEERYIEQITEERLKDLCGDHDRIQEYILESDYENNYFRLVCVGMAHLLSGDDTKATYATFKRVLTSFFEEAVKQEAIDYVEGL